MSVWPLGVLDHVDGALARWLLPPSQRLLGCAGALSGRTTLRLVQARGTQLLQFFKPDHSGHSWFHGRLWKLRGSFFATSGSCRPWGVVARAVGRNDGRVRLAVRPCSILAWYPTLLLVMPMRQRQLRGPASIVGGGLGDGVARLPWTSHAVRQRPLDHTWQLRTEDGEQVIA